MVSPFSFIEPDGSFDVLIIGGGVNGCGIARDLSLRGIKCLLVEKNDFSAGTSGSSSGMIHGGARYLLSDWKVTQLSCLDSGYIQNIIPNLLFRIPFLVPVYSPHSNLRDKILFSLTEGFFATYDRFVRLKNGHFHSRLTANETLQITPEINADGLLGSISFDEWGIDVPRLCFLNAKDAEQNGSKILNHTEVTDLNFLDSQNTQAILCHRLTGESLKIKTRVIINATGPWSPHFAKKFGIKIPMRPGKGIHLTLDRRLSNVAVVCKSIDNRQVFIMPYENHSIIGTTDDDFFDNLDEQRTTDDEILYLLEAVARYFPKIREAKIKHTWSGVRPTLYELGPSEDDLSREHEIISHKEQGLSGFYSIIGGKLASYRIMSEEISDLVAKDLGNTQICSTQNKLLPGATSENSTIWNSQNIDSYTLSRLHYRHGTQTKDLIDQNDEMSVVICPCEGVTRSELNAAVTSELAETLSDIRRRTRCGLGPCQGLNCLRSATSFLPTEHRQSQASTALKAHLSEWWPNRSITLKGAGLAQEELYQAVYYATDCLDLD